MRHVPGPDPDDPKTLDRNFHELLQELRVTQTGVQLLSGFLLTVPFSDRFKELDDVQLAAYVVVFCGSLLATSLLVAPVAFHRVLFRRRQRKLIVELANWCALGGLAVLGLVTSGILFLVIDLVAPRPAAVASLAFALVLFAVIWAVLPLVGAARTHGHVVESGDEPVAEE
ncbi:DUF6328 family protein [Nocardioides jiangxiensis]|uniref:DUF6328 family protein n=1 Tax=Nocardioides jiangxiensis TaxID=3064524 RepID=A0ABT9AX83_9ACTN|nr:DUF6328 family protein [Nocardioides sp. WY-20]MDO7866950.1 DUF6328 family protein [Nocardioides sp. WY-20]